MALLTTCTSANEVTDGVERISITVFSQTTAITSYRYDVITFTRYVGLDLASAKAGATALHDPTNGVIASVRRTHEAGIYEVVVTKTVQGTWSTTP